MAEEGELDFAAELEFQSLIDQLQNEKETFVKSRIANFPKFAIASRKEFQNNKNVKSDVKKSSAFVKKIRSINTEGIQQCIRDTDTLNLTQYISEIVASIVATTFKAADCSHMVKLCISLHMKYEDFTEPLVTGLKQALFAPTAGTGNEEDGANSENNKRKRIQIRFLIELYQTGLCNEEDVMYQLLRQLLGKPTKLGGGPANAKGVIDLQGISTFVKYGSEILCGYPPKKAIDIFSRYGKPVPVDLPLKVLTNPKIMRDFQDLLTDTYAILSDDLVKAYTDYMQKEKKFEKDRLIHGSLTEAKQSEYEYSKKLYDKLFAIVTSLAECMSMKVPELKFEEEEEGGSTGLTVWEGSGTNPNSNVNNLIGLIAEDEAGVAAGGYYGDPDTRSFYEDLPDLLTLVPLTVLGITPEQANEIREEWVKKEEAKLMNKASGASSTNTANADDGTDGSTVPTDNTALTGGLEDTGDGTGGDENVALDESMFVLDEGENETTVNPSDKLDSNATVSAAGGGEETTNPTATTSVGMKVNALLADKLPECFNKAKADEFCVSFCYLSPVGVLPSSSSSTTPATTPTPVITVAQSKQNRKKLATTLTKIPRGRQELIPYYARILATLSRIYPDIVPVVIDSLKKEFYGFQRFKKTSHLENKLKNLKYITECIKFFLCPPIVIFRIFICLLQDLTAHNIELLSVGLETCGRFLYLLPYTRDYMENEILERMLRLQRHKNLSLYQQHLLQGAYFNVKPTVHASGGGNKASSKAKKSVLEAYVQYLLVERLSSQDISIDTVIKSLRRLPWQVAIPSIPPPNTSIESIEEETAATTAAAAPVTPEKPQERDTVEGYVIKYAIKLSRVKYVAIGNLADCLSGLSKYYPNVIVRLVDQILEEIQRALDMPFKRDIQRTVGVTKLLGELYNYTAIPSTIIFDLLYALISAPTMTATLLTTSSLSTVSATTVSGASMTGVAVNGAAISGAAVSASDILHTQAHNSFLHTFTPTVLDPKASPIDTDTPTDLFRAQLICELLLTCGQYYISGPNKEKLTRFLLYFQRYLCAKQLIPLHIEYLLLDTLDYLEEEARESLSEQVKKSALKEAQVLAEKKRKSSGRGGLLPVIPDVSALHIPISFPRYDSYEAVQAVIGSMEQQEVSRRGGIGIALTTTTNTTTTTTNTTTPAPTTTSTATTTTGAGAGATTTTNTATSTATSTAIGGAVESREDSSSHKHAKKKKDEENTSSSNKDTTTTMTTTTTTATTAVTKPKTNSSNKYKEKQHKKKAISSKRKDTGEEEREEDNVSEGESEDDSVDNDNHEDDEEEEDNDDNDSEEDEDSEDEEDSEDDSDDSEDDENENDDEDDSDTEEEDTGTTHGNTHGNGNGIYGNDEEEEDEAMSEQHAAQVLEQLRIAEEDDEFEKAFKHMMTESVLSSAIPSSGSHSTKQNVDRMVLPTVFPKPKNAHMTPPVLYMSKNTSINTPLNTPLNTSSNTTVNTESVAGGNPDSASTPRQPPLAAMQFKLLSRDTKGRLETRALFVPQETLMAQKLLKAEEELRVEKQRIKERVLQINSLNAEYYEMEDEGSLAGSGLLGSMNTNTTTVSSVGAVGGSAAMTTTSAGAMGGVGITTNTGTGSGRYGNTGNTGSGTSGGGTGNRGGSGRYGHHGSGGGSGGGGGVRAEETRKGANTLNLDEFLAEVNASEIRRISTRGGSNKY